MRAVYNRCIECDHVITNPICSDCLAEEMVVMISEYDPKLAAEITGFALEGDTFCLKCKKGMSLCAHCFSRDVYDYLEERNPKVAKEFVNKFDFDLRANLSEKLF